jgi:hypothetical protein
MQSIKLIFDSLSAFACIARMLQLLPSALRKPVLIAMPETACGDKGILPDSFDASKPAGSPDTGPLAEEELPRGTCSGYIDKSIRAMER